MQIAIHQDVYALSRLYADEGYDTRLVGGCVRDAIRGRPPKDLDIATTATPEQQIALCEKHKLRWLGLGLDHGTVGIVLGSGVYEVTTLRRERNHDGRHADCEWTTNWREDASRRDLRPNAMSLGFDGQMHDYFGGCQDIRDGRVRFVGDAMQRIEEDYLRSLRFLRFHPQLAGQNPLDPEAEAAIVHHRTGLDKLSAERVRTEMEKIITGPHAVMMLDHVDRLGLRAHIGLPQGVTSQLPQAIANGVTDPHDRLAAHLGYDQIATRDLADAWKLSGAVRERMDFVTREHRPTEDDAERRLKRFLAHDRVPLDHVVALAKASDRPDLADVLGEWTVPKCPVNGRDLMALGQKPGPTFGKTLGAIVARWADSNYALDRTELLKPIKPSVQKTGGMEL